jgi:hypothetical protein
MKLSEAIREGAKLRPQTRGLMFGADGLDGELCSCALGAAYEAALRERGTNLSERDLWRVFTKLACDFMQRELWPGLTKTVRLVNGKPLLLQEAIVHLNDVEKLSREEIADQVEAWGF